MFIGWKNTCLINSRILFILEIELGLLLLFQCLKSNRCFITIISQPSLFWHLTVLLLQNKSLIPHVTTNLRAATLTEFHFSQGEHRELSHTSSSAALNQYKHEVV